MARLQDFPVVKNDHSLAMREVPNRVRERPSSWAAAAALLALALGAYANSFSGPFIFDDLSSIVKNGSLSRFWPPWSALASPSGGGTRGRPVANLTFTFNHWAGGTAVGGYHALNLGIHLLAGWVVFGIVRRTFLQPRLAPRFARAAAPLGFAVAALWLVHPLLTEAVTYLSQRTELLMGLCYLSTLYCVIRGAQSERHAGRWDLLAVGLCFLGMASKEIMITAPVIIFLYDRTFLAGTFAQAWSRRKRLYLALASSWILLAYLMGGIGGRGAGLGLGVTPGRYALGECWAVVNYVGLAFWPHPLVFDYGTQLGPGGWAAAPFVAAVLAAGLGAVWALWHRPAAGFALVWVLAILAPTSSFVPIALQPVAEHRMYLPLLGLTALAVAGLYRGLGRLSFALWAGVLIGLVWTTRERNQDYRTAIGLWEDTVEKRPGNPRAHGNLGSALLSDGQIEAGTAELTAALRLAPDDPEANLDLGVELAKKGDFTAAVSRIQTALRANPALAEGYFNLGWIDAKIGKENDAAREYTQAIGLRPDYFDAHCNLADLLVTEGKYPEAIPHYVAALTAGPPAPELYFNLAYAEVRAGRFGGAVSDYKQALELRPDFAAARRNLDLLERLQRAPSERMGP